MHTASREYFIRFHVISSPRNSFLGQRSMQLLTVHGPLPLQWATQPSFQFCRPFPPKLPCIPLSLDYLSSLRFPSPLSRSVTTLPPKLLCFANLDGWGHHIQRQKQLEFLHRSVGSVRFLLWTFHPHECLSIWEPSSKTPNTWEVFKPPCGITLWDHLMN